MSATETPNTSDLQEFVNGLREQGLSDTDIAAELDKRAATPEGQAEQAAAVEKATTKPARKRAAAKPKADKAVESKPAKKAAAKPAADKPAKAPKADDGTIRIHLSDTAFKAVEGAKDWRAANKRAWKAISDAAKVRAAKSIPANHYHYPTMQREDVLDLADLLDELKVPRYGGLLRSQAQG